MIKNETKSEVCKVQLIMSSLEFKTVCNNLYMYNTFKCHYALIHNKIYAMSFWSINLCIHLTEDNITNNAYASTGIKNVAVFFSAFSQFVLVEDLIYKHVLELLIQQQIWHLGLLTVNLEKKEV